MPDALDRDLDALQAALTIDDLRRVADAWFCENPGCIDWSHGCMLHRTLCLKSGSLDPTFYHFERLLPDASKPRLYVFAILGSREAVREKLRSRR